MRTLREQLMGVKYHRLEACSTSCLLPLASCLLPTPYSLLPAPCSLSYDKYHDQPKISTTVP
ncbi:MAG: hypothetical protein F6K37_30135 [Moorea sp. SIO4E2]|uniref:hypothetical protein n=1 Tax=Moorena sp. SIO4E2 TaxID=2607826 RepID=UPI0013BCE0AD|nr:hypothetical protein [Moorena sp. SIO4E2]NEQ10037.1 hypothetical protein [Moorena sp. SIO4E2]